MRSTRDRDRLRGEQLERLGWEHVRVWTTDLFRDPARDVSRVPAAVQRAAARRAVEEAARPRRVTVAATSLPPATMAPPAEDLPGESRPSEDRPLEDPAADGSATPSEPTAQAEDTAAPEDAQLTLDGLDPAPEDFTPTPDQGARKRRVRGRRATSKPEQTKDDTDVGWGEQHEELAYDRWLREQRPPHWGSD